jgi:hypothetical protein
VDLSLINFKIKFFASHIDSSADIYRQGRGLSWDYFINMGELGYGQFIIPNDKLYALYQMSTQPGLQGVSATLKITHYE